MIEKTINKKEYEDHINHAMNYLYDDGYAEIEIQKIKSVLLIMWIEKERD